MEFNYKDFQVRVKRPLTLATRNKRINQERRRQILLDTGKCVDELRGSGRSTGRALILLGAALSLPNHQVFAEDHIPERNDLNQWVASHAVELAIALGIEHVVRTSHDSITYDLLEF